MDLYLQKDRTVDQIAEEVGVSRSTIYSWLAIAGVTGRRSHQSVDADQELREQVRQVLGNQLRFMDDIDRMTSALDGLRAEQTSSTGGWMAQLNEARHSLDTINTTLSRLVGAVETLVALRQGPDRN